MQREFRRVSALQTAGLAIFVAMIAFASLCLVEYLQYQRAKASQIMLLRRELRMLALVAAARVDGDTHRRLAHEGSEQTPEYEAALAPLIRFHNNASDLFYVYTMVTVGSDEYYVLDTATRPDLLRTTHDVHGSLPMEQRTPYDAIEDRKMRAAVSAGSPYVYRETYDDPVYGEFLTGVAPIFDSKGEVAGMAAVDYSVEFIDRYMRGLRRSSYTGLTFGFFLALSLGSLVSIFRSMRARGVWERRKADAQIERTVRDYRTAVETSPEGFCVVDLNGRYLDANASYGHLMGTTRQDIIGKRIWEVHTEAPRELVLSRLMTMKEVGWARFEFRRFPSEGETLYFELVGARVADEEDRFFIFVRDVTERKRSLAQLQDNEQRLNEAEAIGRLGHWYLASSLDMVWSPEVYRLYDRKPADRPPSWDAFLRYFGSNADGVLDIFERALLDGVRTEGEFAAVLESGRRAWHHLIVNVRLDDRGRPTEIFGTVQDVSERVAAEEAIRESELKYHRLLDTIPYGVFHKDRDGVILTVNPAFCMMVGRPIEDVIGRKNSDLFDADLAEKYRRDDERIMASLETERIEETYQVGNERRMAMTTKTPVFDAEGNVTGILGVFHDITELRQKSLQLVLLNQQLRDEAQRTLRALEEARAANEYKTRFLANISHEVRSPVNRIRGLTSILQMEPLVDPERKARYLDTIIQSCDVLIADLDHLLMLSRAESGVAKPVMAPFEPVPLLKRLIDRHRIAAESKELALIVDVPFDYPRTLVTDRVMLETILSNLVENAIKFTSAGGVTLSARATPGNEPDRIDAEFDVSDTGIGIPPDEHERIFRSFYQVESYSTRTIQGSGLGLAIAAEFARLLGGSLDVKSEPGRGSTFRFTCPMALGRPYAPPAGADPVT